jgi:hypothetical protein
MSALASIRPGEWELPLFVHVLGALALTGALVVTAAFLFPAWRRSSSDALRLALRALTLGVIPAYVVMRVGAEWIADKEGYADMDDPPGWVVTGYITADAGLLLVIVTSLVAWFAYRRSRREDGAPTGAVRTAAVLIGLLLVLNDVALFAMTTKPA